MPESGINMEEMGKLKELSDLIIEFIRQFIRTKDELMRTTLQVQIELLSARLKRLKVSIGEVKSQIDEVCIPEEAKSIENISGIPVVPYTGASIDSDNNVQEFSWKSSKVLEEEKSAVIEKAPNVQTKIEKIYNFYLGLSMYLYQKPEEKSLLR